MRKTILIPTDFNIPSLVFVKNVLEKINDDEQVNILLLQGVNLTSSITDLLFFSRSRLVESLTNNDFEEGCEILKNKFSSRLNGIYKDVFIGHTQAAFNNYLEANKIDEVYISKSYKMNLHHKESFDIMPYIIKSNIKTNFIENVKLQDEQPVLQLSDLLYPSLSSN